MRILEEEVYPQSVVYGALVLRTSYRQNRNNTKRNVFLACRSDVSDVQG